ncbi:MAG: hypothetical protein Q9207_000129 [Kuettlingeria erythrocarpa]
MAVHNTLSRRIRASKDMSDDEGLTATESDSSTQHVPSAAEAGDASSNERSLDNSDGEATSPGEELAAIPFGALAKAQDGLGKRKGGRHEAFGRSLPVSPTRDIGHPEAAERNAGRDDNKEHARSSKHAPAELSSKKAVSRKREVIPAIKRDVRDPRFEPLTGPLDPDRAKRNYRFLNEYRDSEISELKSAIRQTKDPVALEKLKRALLRMESRRKAQQRKDQEQEVLRTHRAKEKELIKQGKNPFYLKKAEQKKLALVQRFQGMKGQQVDRVMERRRKKEGSRAMRDMPAGRRSIEG